LPPYRFSPRNYYNSVPQRKFGMLGTPGRAGGGKWEKDKIDAGAGLIRDYIVGRAPERNDDRR